MPYVWLVNTEGDGTSITLLDRLVAVMDGCLVPDPDARWKLPRVLEALTALQRDAVSLRLSGTVGGGGSSTGASGLGGGTTGSSTAASTAGVKYDVLAIIDAMEALSIDVSTVSAVANTIGTSLTASLDALSLHKVPIMQKVGVRKSAECATAAHEQTTSVRNQAVP